MTTVFSEIRRHEATGAVLCGLIDFRDKPAYVVWQAFAAQFLEQYCSEETDIEVSITTSERQDWYSEFCVENQIEVSLKKLSKVLVQVVAKPKGREQKSALLRALVEDEAWEVGGCLDIRVGDASIRPDGDGTSFNWTGPSALIPRVQEAIDSAAASNPVTLLHR